MIYCVLLLCDLNLSVVYSHNSPPLQRVTALHLPPSHHVLGLSPSLCQVITSLCQVITFSAPGHTLSVPGHDLSVPGHHLSVPGHHLFCTRSYPLTARSSPSLCQVITLSVLVLVTRSAPLSASRHSCCVTSFLKLTTNGLFQNQPSPTLPPFLALPYMGCSGSNVHVVI